jgi:hypothetical protein
MTVLDCADPSMRVDKRNESLSPLQALAMMNNGLTVAMAKHFAQRVRKKPTARSTNEARLSPWPSPVNPKPMNSRRCSTTRNAKACENTCRVILNLNEFSFVD